MHPNESRQPRDAERKKLTEAESSRIGAQFKADKSPQASARERRRRSGDSEQTTPCEPGRRIEAASAAIRDKSVEKRQEQVLTTGRFRVQLQEG